MAMAQPFVEGHKGTIPVMYKVRLSTVSSDLQKF